MKFDGEAPDGARVVMRSCGYFSANECAQELNFEGTTGVEGMLCHCLEDE